MWVHIKKERCFGMANKRTKALTEEQYRDIIDTMREGFSGCRPNNRIATALVLEANLGIRISDILNLKLKDIVKDGNRYRLDIVEIKTKKKRIFTVPLDIYSYIQSYCIENDIRPDERIFPITERAIQKQLKIVTDWLGYDDISTHSFRKFFATEIYKNNDYNIILVQKLLQHSTPAVTQKYIGLSSKEIETALEKHTQLR
jgi:integrase